MKDFSRILAGPLVAVCVLLGPTVSSAELIVTDLVTPTGGLFHHEFTVINATGADVVIVSITDAPAGEPLIAATLSVPAGFLGSYDSGLGIVDFLSDVLLFLDGATTPGFEFDSASGPGLFESFTALTLDGVELSGDVVTRIARVPVPGPPVLLALALGLLVLRRAGRC